MSVTAKQLEQKRKNVKAINNKRAKAERCQRGHSRWGIRRDGRRVCLDCKDLRQWYYKQGLAFPGDPVK